MPRFLKSRVAKEEPVLIGDPRVEGWESVSTFKDRRTAVPWRDQLRSMGVEASCVADHPLDRFGQWDIYLMVRRSNGPEPARSLTTSSEP